MMAAEEQVGGEKAEADQGEHGTGELEKTVPKLEFKL